MIIINSITGQQNKRNSKVDIEKQNQTKSKRGRKKGHKQNVSHRCKTKQMNSIFCHQCT